MLSPSGVNFTPITVLTVPSISTAVSEQARLPTVSADLHSTHNFSRLLPKSEDFGVWLNSPEQFRRTVQYPVHRTVALPPA